MKSKRKKYLAVIISIHLLAFFAIYIFHNPNSFYGIEANVDIPQFEMIDHLERNFTRENLSQNYFFLYFGFLHCYGVCPKSVFTMTKLTKEITDLDVRFAFITLDPYRDDIQKLNTYIQNRDNRFVGLRQDDLEKLTNFTKSFRIQFSKELFVKENSNYQMYHNSSIFLVHKSLHKMIQYPDGLDDINQIKLDFQKFKNLN